jgi:hypothetical protein
MFSSNSYGARKHLALLLTMVSTNVNIMSVRLPSCLSYIACKSHLFYVVLELHLWPVEVYHIFPHHLIKRTIFGKRY